ncbi:MAG: hypothetical protein ACW98K_04490, partial [Candidatus Kariarchaeaceae archaeon]
MSKHHLDLAQIVEETDHVPPKIKELFNDFRRSVSLTKNKYRIKKFSKNFLDLWVRSQYKLDMDERIIKRDKLIVSHIDQFQGDENKDYRISVRDFQTILEIDRELEVDEQKRIEKFTKLKAEVEKLRLQRKKKRAKPPRAKPTVDEEEKKEILVNTIDYDYIYGKWIDHIQTKSTSKSYWYIHEYIGRFILKFAINQRAESISEQV